MRDPSNQSLTSGGIERLLVQAALDPGFRQRLLDHRESLLASGELRLTPHEERLLRLIPRAQLAASIDQLAVPSPSRRGFIRAAPAALVAALATSGLGGAPGCPAGHGDNSDAGDGSLASDVYFRCDGSRPDPPTCDTNQPGGDYWITLGGQTAFLHLPPSYAPYEPAPMCIAYHDRGGSCLSMVALWRDVADLLGFSLVAPKWSGSPDEAEATRAALGWITSELEYTYCVRAAGVVLAGTGTGGTFALSGVLSPPPTVGFSEAVAFGGPLPEGWQDTPLESPGGKYLYLSSTARTELSKSITRDLAALEDLGVHTRHVVQQPDGEPVPDGPEEAWRWLWDR